MMTWKQKQNLTLWLIAVRRAYHEEPAGQRKDFLKAMLVDIILRIAV